MAPLKGKIVPFYVMKAYRGSRGITPLIPNLEQQTVVRSYLHDLVALPLSPPPPWKKSGVNEIESWVAPWAGLEVSEKRKIFEPAGIRAPGRAALS